MNEEDAQGQAEPDTPMAEAGIWFARMRGPEAEAHQPEFEAWLARGALNRGFYNRLGEVYAMGKFLKAEPDEDEDHADDIAPADRRHGRFWRLGGILIAACMVATLLVFLMPRRQPRPAGISVAEASALAAGALRLETSKDQSLSQQLPDGSVVTLAETSVLRVAYGARTRALILERGEARFNVAHELRPFIVRAGRGSVTARGTIFDVSLSGTDHVTVRLLRGAVDVVPDATEQKPLSTRRLLAGEQVSYAASGLSAAMATPSRLPSSALPPLVLEEMQEITEFSAMPLGDVVALANRRGGRPIRLATADLSGLKVSGRFRLDDPERLAEKIGGAFDLPVDASNPRELVLRHR